MRGVLLIIDGLGDLPVAALGGETPLEAARTPVLDRLASNGQCGLVDPIEPGQVPNTHSGAGLLLGMSPSQADRLHRGPVEAAGVGMTVRPGDVALRSNFATLRRLDGHFEVIERRAGRISEGTEELAAMFQSLDLGDGISATLRSTEQHRGVLLLSGPGLDFRVTDTDPGDRLMPAALPACRALRAEAGVAAEKVNRFIFEAHRRLADHAVNRARIAAGKTPANGVITRGAGAVLKLDNLLRQRGLRAGVVSGCNTVRGLGHLFGFTVVRDERFTGALDTDLDAKVATAISMLDQCDVVFIHIKAPDVCAHDRQPLAKRDFLERLDRALGPLAEMSLVVAVAADHTTDSNTGFHTADPVPALLHVPASDSPGNAVEFGEAWCRDGPLGRLVSQDFLMRFVRAVTG
jgi:2,3-bisphosphoglycerate-independent phosphoglycerate mutase